ncbi:MAG TPA: DinB family protein [Vicinamibacterales bacterium]|nr:DinB family protein [Vicinamibacterales bacterium]
MPLKDALLPDLDRELGATRRLLERVPADRFDWRPHEKSRSLGQLATHLAAIPRWGVLVLQTTQSDIAGQPDGDDPAATPQEVLALFDRHAGTLRAQLAQTEGDGPLLVRWTLEKDGQEVFSLPRVSALRTIAMNHLIHHRGQLTVYLRLLGVPLPPMYGPTADEA